MIISLVFSVTKFSPNSPLRMVKKRILVDLNRIFLPFLKGKLPLGSSRVNPHVLLVFWHYTSNLTFHNSKIV
jgi:hypothetical protein